MPKSACIIIFLTKCYATPIQQALEFILKRYGLTFILLLSFYLRASACACVRVRACVCACVRACVRFHFFCSCVFCCCCVFCLFLTSFSTQSEHNYRSFVSKNTDSKSIMRSYASLSTQCQYLYHTALAALRLPSQIPPSFLLPNLWASFLACDLMACVSNRYRRFLNVGFVRR